MAKVVILLKAPDGEPPPGFGAALLAKANDLAGRADVGGLTVNLVDMIAPYPGDLAGAEVRADPPFDVFVELWNSAAAVSADVVDAVSAGARIVGAYAIEEFVEKNEIGWKEGPADGIRLLSLIFGRRDLTRDEIKLGWRRHVGPALISHHCMTRYVRNWVREALTPNALDIDGVAALNFPTDEDLRERFYDPPSTRPALAADTGRFVQQALNVYAREHVVRAPHTASPS